MFSFRAAKMSVFLLLFFTIFFLAASAYDPQKCNEAGNGKPSDAHPISLTYTGTMRDGNVYCAKHPGKCSLGDKHIIAQFPHLQHVEETDTEFCEESGSKCPGLGQGFYLNSLNAASILSGGAQVFTKVGLDNCATFNTLALANSAFSYSSSTQQLVRNLQAQTSISGDYKSLSFSMEGTVSASTGFSLSQDSTISTSVMEKSFTNGVIDLTKNSECQGPTALSEQFLKSLQELPVSITDPSSFNSWQPYVSFLKAFGSHVVVQLSIGAKFQKWGSIASSSVASQETLQAKACFEVEGTSGSSGWSVETCAGYYEDEKRAASQVSANSKTNIVGGTASTRAALLNENNPKTLADFINSAANADEAIAHRFTSIWDIVSFAFINDASMLQRSENLRAAYDGWMAFGCPLLHSGTVTYQKFQAMPGSVGEVVKYGCWNKKQGCSSDDDCHLGGAGSVCYCYGNSCIHVDSTNRGVVRTGQTGSYDQDINNSCYYKFFAHCNCDTMKIVGLGDRFIWS